MIELKKTAMCVGERTISTFSQAYCEADMIVPDVKPDIAKLLQWDATIAVHSKTCHNDRIAIEGKATVTILYLGEGGRVCGMNSTQPFSHIIDAKGVSEGMDVDIETSVESVECTLINSRKVSVQLLIGVDANACVAVEADFCTEILGETRHETLYKTVKPYATVARSQDQICIKGRLEIPAGKPSIETILSMNAKITSKECKALCDKVIVKGMLCVNTLYLGDMDENNVQFMEHEIPFSEVVEAQGMEEDMEVKCRCTVAQVYHDVEADYDGDCRIVMVECLVDVHLKACSETQVQVIEDAYCPECPLLVSKQTAEMNRLVAESKTQVSLKEVATISEAMPDIMQIYNVIARPHVATTRVEAGKVVIEGVIETNILYLSDDSTSPINTYKQEHPFSQQIEMAGAEPSMMCDIGLDIGHLNYTISMGREVDLRFVLDIGVKVLTTEQVVHIADIQQGEQAQAPQTGYCMRIYFVRKGDRLWDIAKKYGTTMERILQANDMSEESELFSGKQLMIR